MADAAKSSEQPAEVTSPPTRESRMEAAPPDKGSASAKSKPQPEAPRSDSSSVPAKSEAQPQEIKHSRSRLRRFAPVFLVLLLAVGLLVVITTNWNAWV